MQNKEGDLRIWHIPQVPGKPFYVGASNEREAKLLLGVLADYDSFQFANKIKPDYCNASGAERFDGSEWIGLDDDELEKAA